MTRAKHVYVCQQCGANYPKWSGRCDNCGQWNTLVEEMVQPEKKAVVDRVRGQVVQSQPFASVAVDAVAERLATGF